jgi:hypothetical protein
MTSRRLAILSAVVLALLAFIHFYEKKQPTSQERLDQGDVLWTIPEDKIARITIVRGPETLEFSREPDASWKMVKPDSYPADASSLSSLLFDLAHPRREGEASESAATPEYGLGSPRAVVTVAPKEEKGAKLEGHTLSIGSEIPGTDTVAARVKGENRIVFVASSFATDLLKPLASFKSRKIFPGSAADVTQLTISRGRGRIEFEKKLDDWWMVKPEADLADSAMLSRLAGDLLAENVSEFLKITDADLAGDGLAPPIYTVSLTISKKPITLEIGATRADGKSVYARGNGQTFALDSSITDELSKEADAYREKKPVRFGNADVKAFSATLDGRTLDLKKEGSEWKESGKAVPTASAEDALTAVSSLVSKDFLSAQDYARVENKPDTASLKIELKAGEPWTMSAKPIDPKRLALKVSSRPEALIVDSTDFDRVTSALRKIAPQAPQPKVPEKKN